MISTKKNILGLEAPTSSSQEQPMEHATKYNKETYSLSTFLKQFKVEKGEDFTHTCIGPPFGSYYIPNNDLNTFFKLYTRDFNNQIPIHITERHKAFSPILIDIDFKQNTSDRIYDQDYIIKFLQTLVYVLKDYIKYEQLNCYVLEKNEPRVCSSGGFKDGFHIVIPDIITSPIIQYEIRNIILSKYYEAIKIHGATNQIDDIYDKSVIEKNNWLIYGSQKPDDLFSWKVSYIYQFNNTIISAIKVENDHSKYIKLLSIRYNIIEESRYTEAGKQFIKNENKSINTSIAHSNNNNDEIEALINILDISRADHYDLWIKLGWCLHNIDYTLLYKWIEFSKKSNKYKNGECEKIWKDMKNEGLNIGTLHKWAKEDAPMSYIELMIKYKNSDNLVSIDDIRKSVVTYNYEYVKNVFEKKHFKIMDPISYIESNNNDILRNTQTIKEAYRNLYCKFNKNEESVKFIDKWLDDRNIKTFTNFDFCPSPLLCPKNVYNMWKGFYIDHIIEESSNHIQPFIDHLNILVGNKGLDYFIKWLAQLIQQPGKLIGIALIFLSEEGAGKNIFWDLFSEMIGKEYYYETANPERDLFGRFCNGRKHKLIIDLDEANSKDTFTNSELLKNMITSTHFNYEQKGINPVELKNFARLVFTTNNILCAKINDNTRRYVVYETSNKMIGNTKYFNEFASYMNDTKNQKAIMEYLRSIDITDVNWIKDRPITETYEALKSLSIDPILKYFAYLVEKNFNKNEVIITTHDLHNDFIAFLRDHLKMKEESINVITMRILSCQINNKYCNSEVLVTGIDRKLNIGKKKLNGFVMNLIHLKSYLESKGFIINLCQL
jgi:hypothetical protein